MLNDLCFSECSSIHIHILVFTVLVWSVLDDVEMLRRASATCRMLFERSAGRRRRRWHPLGANGVGWRDTATTAWWQPPANGQDRRANWSTLRALLGRRRVACPRVCRDWPRRDIAAPFECRERIGQASWCAETSEESPQCTRQELRLSEMLVCASHVFRYSSVPIVYRRALWFRTFETSFV